MESIGLTAPAEVADADTTLGRGGERRIGRLCAERESKGY